MEKQFQSILRDHMSMMDAHCKPEDRPCISNHTKVLSSSEYHEAQSRHLINKLEAALNDAPVTLAPQMGSIGICSQTCKPGSVRCPDCEKNNDSK